MLCPRSKQAYFLFKLVHGLKREAQCLNGVLSTLFPCDFCPFLVEAWSLDQGERPSPVYGLLCSKRLMDGCSEGVSMKTGHHWVKSRMVEGHPMTVAHPALSRLTQGFPDVSTIKVRYI